MNGLSRSFIRAVLLCICGCAALPGLACLAPRVGAWGPADVGVDVDVAGHAAHAFSPTTRSALCSVRMWSADAGLPVRPWPSSDAPLLWLITGTCADLLFPYIRRCSKYTLDHHLPTTAIIAPRTISDDARTHALSIACTATTTTPERCPKGISSLNACTSAELISLRDEEATRDAVITPFRALPPTQRYPTRIPILIYYAGYGSETTTPTTRSRHDTQSRHRSLAPGTTPSPHTGMRAPRTSRRRSPSASTSTSGGTASTTASVVHAIADFGMWRRRSTGASGAETMVSGGGVGAGFGAPSKGGTTAKRKSHKAARMSLGAGSSQVRFGLLLVLLASHFCSARGRRVLMMTF